LVRLGNKHYLPRLQIISNLFSRENDLDKDIRTTRLKQMLPLSLIVKDTIKNLIKSKEYNNSLLILAKYFELNSDSFNILVSYVNMLKQVKEYSVHRQIIEKTSLDTPEKISLVCFVTKSLPKNDSFYQAGLLKIEASLRAYLYDLGLIDDYDMRFDISEFIRDRPNYLIRKVKSFLKNNLEEKNVEVWKFLFYLNPLNDQVISECTNNLMQHNCIEDTFKIYDISLELLPDNINILTKYANFLFRQCHYEFSFDLYECALKLEPNNLITLNSYANALVKQGNYVKALELLAFSLELDDRDVRTLTCYANTLFKLGEYEKSLHILEINLQLEPYNIITLTNYATTLIKLEKFLEAFAVFEKAIQENPYDIHLLRTYAKSLADYGNIDKAFQLFEIALSINNTDSRTLNDYSSLLIQYEKWSVLAKINHRKPYFRLKYAQYLEREGDYESALSQLLDIDLATQKTYHANIIRLNLGRLYYRLGQIERGKQFFEEAIANSDEQDKTILYAARSLLATNPNSQEAINLLLKIQEDSPRYAEAMKAIALNADEETSYELFGADEEQIDDIEMLYRAMYHKIGNEIAVLRSISYRLLKRMEGEHPLVKEIVNDLEKLQQGIASQRANEKAAIAETSHSNYKQLIEIVSKTAHDISDEVNNQLAVIESKTRRAMRKLTAENPQYQQFEKFLLQLKITQKAINDLKSINEGKTIRRNRFLVHQLFEKWEPENWTSQPRIDGVRIRLDIRNPDSEFNGDEEKIKSILNELVENSLKHNHGNPNLSIRMYSSDIDNPMDVGSPTIPGDRKFLYIEFKDNGQGVPNDKKDWIFQPLKTTSPEDKGSGLGLFIARKTIKKMGGQIREVGEAGKGVRFQIYLPYL